MGDLKTSWDAFNARQQIARDRWLRGTLNGLSGLYARLGIIGARFLQDFAATGCVESVDLQLSARASFQAHHRTQGFINKIFYSVGVLPDEAALFSSRTHEAIHAIQFSRAAAAHATPFNAAAKIMLCPRDAVLLEELKERDAFSKQWLLDKMANDPGYAALDPGALEQDLREHAACVLQSLRWNDAMSFLDYYRGKALDEYETVMAARHEAEPDLVYVRLEPEDILSIGGSLRLQSFDAGWSSVPLTPEQETRLAALNRVFGIDDEGNLPTLGQALRMRGTDRAAFLAASLEKGRNSAPKPPSPPCL